MSIKCVNICVIVKLGKLRKGFGFYFFREFTLDASVEMPYEISSLSCITHSVKIKVTPPSR